MAAQIRENWQDVIQKIRNVSLGALLRDASVTGIDEQGQLVLSFQHTFHCKKVDEPVNREELERVLSNNLNYLVNVRCLMNGDWHAPAQTESVSGDESENDQKEPPSSEPVEEDVLIRRAQEELGAVATIDGT
jgi:hypothetical protein